jgi:hypothetical protein
VATGDRPVCSLTAHSAVATADVVAGIGDAGGCCDNFKTTGISDPGYNTAESHTTHRRRLPRLSLSDSKSLTKFLMSEDWPRRNHETLSVSAVDPGIACSHRPVGGPLRSNRAWTGHRPVATTENAAACAVLGASAPRLDHREQHRHNFRRGCLQNVKRQSLRAFLGLRRLAVDKDPEIALLIFYEEIEVLLVDLSFL